MVKKSKKNNRKTSKKIRSKKRINKKLKRKSQSGGFQIRLTQVMIDTFENPHTFPEDCCPCVFHLLGMDRDKIQELINEHDFTQSGMTEELIQDFFRYVYPEYQFWFREIIGPYNMFGWEKKIFGDIYAGYATLGGITRNDNSKHCIIFAKHPNGEMHIFDAQYARMYIGRDAVYGYLTHNTVRYVNKLYSMPNLII